MNHLLQDITSGDPTTVRSSSCEIIKSRDKQELDYLASKLEAIREQTKGLALGGALFPNAEHLKFALRKLEYHRSRAGCLCLLYPGYLFYNPQQEAEAGNVTIESTSYLEGKWVDFYECVCTTCGKRYRVEERESHYTWWGWKALER